MLPRPPAPPRPGRPWRSHRQVINGILWVLATGSPWRDLPERTQAIALLESVHIGRRRRPRHLAGDRAYATVAVRQWGEQHPVQLSISERVDHVRHRRRYQLPAPAFNRAACRGRNIIERAVGWFKHARRWATRAEKLATHYQALLALALSVRYANQYLSDTT